MKINDLAYIGDAVYELCIREYLIKTNLKPNELSKLKINYVSARKQCEFVKKMMKDFLTEEEKEIVIKGRNHKTNSCPKSVNIITYKYATGFECLIGYLYLNKKYDRIKQITGYIINGG